MHEYCLCEYQLDSVVSEITTSPPTKALSFNSSVRVDGGGQGGWTPLAEILAPLAGNFTDPPGGSMKPPPLINYFDDICIWIPVKASRVELISRIHLLNYTYTTEGQNLDNCTVLHDTP